MKSQKKNKSEVLHSAEIKAQRKNLRGKSDKFIYLLRNKISNNYGN